MPLDLKTAAAPGPENILINACAASLFWGEALKPAAYVVEL
jgi:hypothetical protein